MSGRNNIREVQSRQLLIPETVEVMLSVPAANLGASVWNSYQQQAMIPRNPEAELLFVDGDTTNCSIYNLVFDEPAAGIKELPPIED